MTTDGSSDDGISPVERALHAEWAFDADPAEWRLAAEALRIRCAALYDPMLAVSTSDLDPLPHQLWAVYGELLPRTPLRFLLADDPGAGKTIMVGLYLKELILRGDLERCPIVAPGSLVEQWRDELSEKFGLAFDVLTRAAIDGVREPRQVFAQRPRLSRAWTSSRGTKASLRRWRRPTGTSSSSTRRTACRRTGRVRSSSAPSDTSSGCCSAAWPGICCS